MDDKRFDALWQRAEAESYASRLAAEYPAWRTRRRRTAGIMSAMVLAIAVAAPLVYHPRPSVHIYCNNPAINDNHWTEMADALLMEA